MVSIFGPDDWDQRDYRMGLAGLLAGVHALRILAERGIASAEDITVACDGMNAVLDQITTWRAGEREKLNLMLSNLVAAAAKNNGNSNG